MKNKPHFLPALVACGLLFGAAASLPYGYYQFLRWAVCGVSAYVAYKAYKWNAKWVAWLFGAIAVLFNPFVPVYLTREIWLPIDIGCAVLFVVIAILLKEPVAQINFCPNCGHRLSVSVRYCPKCGQAVNSPTLHS